MDDALEALRIFDEHGDLRGTASALRVLGEAYRYLGRLDEAAQVLRRGLEIAQRVGNVEEVGGCLSNLGIVEAGRGNTDDALACFRQAVDEFDRVGHASGRATAYSNLAYMLGLTGHYDEALEYCEKTLELAESIGASLVIAGVYDTMASIELDRGNHSLAALRAEEASRLYVEMGVLREAEESLGRAAEAWEQAGDEERAREVTQRARDLAVTE